MPVPDQVGAMALRVPDAGATAVLVYRALDLVRAGGGTPEEALGEADGGTVGRRTGTETQEGWFPTLPLWMCSAKV